MGCVLREVVSAFELPTTTLSELHFPPMLSRAVGAIHLCHYMGRVLFRFETRTRAPIQYMAGVVTNAVYGDNRFVQVVAQIVAVARELFAIIEEGGGVLVRWQGVWSACSLPSLPSLVFAENRLIGGVRIDELVDRLSTFLSIAVSALQLIALRVAELVAAVWCLNLHLFAMYDAIWLNPNSRSAAIDDVFINLGEVADHIMGTERQLLKAVTEYRALVDTVFQLVHSDCSAQMIIDRLAKIASGVEGVRKLYEEPIAMAILVGTGMADTSIRAAGNFVT